MSSHIIPLGLGELRASRDPQTVLVCYGLGSCISICLYDSVAHVGAQAHVVLPDSARQRDVELPGRFANTAVPRLVEEMIGLGAQRSRLVARLAGGAQMLKVGATARLDIGTRNCEAARIALQATNILLAAEDLGGSHGRTVQLIIADGRVVVSTVGRGEHVL